MDNKRIEELLGGILEVLQEIKSSQALLLPVLKQIRLDLFTSQEYSSPAALLNKAGYAVTMEQTDAILEVCYQYSKENKYTVIRVDSKTDVFHPEVIVYALLDVLGLEPDDDSFDND